MFKVFKSRLGITLLIWLMILFIVLVIATISLFITSFDRFAVTTISESKKDINKAGSYLLLANTREQAKWYSILFDEINSNTDFIATLASSNLKIADELSKIQFDKKLDINYISFKDGKPIIQSPLKKMKL
jgi:hypothetical protein